MGLPRAPEEEQRRWAWEAWAVEGPISSRVTWRQEPCNLLWVRPQLLYHEIVDQVFRISRGQRNAALSPIPSPPFVSPSGTFQRGQAWLGSGIDKLSGSSMHHVFAVTPDYGEAAAAAAGVTAAASIVRILRVPVAV